MLFWRLGVGDGGLSCCPSSFCPPLPCVVSDSIIYTPAAKPRHPRVAFLMTPAQRASPKKSPARPPGSPSAKSIVLSDRSYTVRILEESLVYSIQALNELEVELDEKQARVSESTDAEIENLVRRIHAQIGCIDRFELTLKACMEEQESAQALHMAFQTNPGPGTPMSMSIRASPIMPADEFDDTAAEWTEYRQEEPGSPTSLIAEPTQAPMTPFDETMALLNVRPPSNPFAHSSVSSFCPLK